MAKIGREYIFLFRVLYFGKEHLVLWNISSENRKDSLIPFSGYVEGDINI